MRTATRDVTEATVASPGAAPSPGVRGAAKLAIGAADAVCLALCLAVAYLIRESGDGPDIQGAWFEHLVVALLLIPVWIGLFARRRLYNSRFIVRRVDEWRRIMHGSASAIFAVAAASYALQLAVSRAWLVLAGVLSIGVVGLEREIVRRVFARMRTSGKLMRDVVIVGNNEEARDIAAMLLDDPTLGYRVVGFLADGEDDGVLGTAAEAMDVVRRTGAGGVIVASSSLSAAVCNRLVRDLLHCGVHVELSSTLRDVAPERLTVRPLGRYPVLYLEPCRPVGWRSAAKRTFDSVSAALGLLVVAPLGAAIAAAIRLDSPGPVIFKQVRVGKDGRPFEVRKFRTMVQDAEALVEALRAHNEADGPLFKLREDPRVTRVGRFLRKTSLDELPQLVNVLRGEMSLVGPRPALPEELVEWDPQLHARLRVRPGITGMWQVNGRSDSSFESYSRLDLYYVENWSLFNDVTILAKTIPTVLFGRGAY